MTIGYDYKIWHEYGEKLPINISLDTHPHTLITGSSGSGKSHALRYMLYGLSKEQCDIWCLDFKNSGEYDFMKGKKHFYTGNNCINGIEQYYSLFQEVKNKETVLEKRQILIMDEYPAFILYLTHADKKLAEIIKQRIAEILLMGRSMLMGLWVTCQRPDASLFNNGVRENFMVLITFCKISPETKRMLYADETIPDRIYQKGEGVILIDGMELRELKIPFIKGVSYLEQEISSHMC